MNWKYLVIGLVIIIVPFAILFFRINSVSNTINNTDTAIEPEQKKQPVVSIEKLPDGARREVSQEGSTVLFLSRGRVTSFDNENNSLEITAETKLRQGEESKIETKNETIDLSSLRQAKCWPEKVPVGNGQTASILDAYFPINANTDLYLTKEKVISYDEAKEFLKPGVFVFVKKKSPTNDPAFVAQQLVIVGC